MVGPRSRLGFGPSARAPKSVLHWQVADFVLGALSPGRLEAGVAVQGHGVVGRVVGDGFAAGVASPAELQSFLKESPTDAMSGSIEEEERDALEPSQSEGARDAPAFFCHEGRARSLPK